MTWKTFYVLIKHAPKLSLQSGRTVFHTLRSEARARSIRLFLLVAQFLSLTRCLQAGELLMELAAYPRSSYFEKTNTLILFTGSNLWSGRQKLLKSVCLTINRSRLLVVGPGAAAQRIVGHLRDRRLRLWWRGLLLPVNTNR